MGETPADHQDLEPNSTARVRYDHASLIVPQQFQERPLFENDTLPEVVERKNHHLLETRILHWQF